MPVKQVFSAAIRLGNSIHSPRALCVRSLSSHPYRERSGSRPAANRSRDSGDRRVSKSLIDDEEELSNWVSDLRSDSFSGRSKTDNDDSDGGRGFGRGRGRRSDMQRRSGGEFGDRTQWSSGRSQSRDSYRGPGRFGRESEDDKVRSRGRPSSSTRDGNGKFFNEENRFSERSSRGRPSSSTRDNVRRGSEARSTRGSLLNSRLSPRKEGFTPKKPFEEEEDEEEEDDSEEQRKSLTDLISDESEGENSDGDGDDEFMKKSVNSLFGDDHTENVQRTTVVKSDSYLSDTRFDECSLSPLTLKGIKDAGYEKMTVVQAATLPVILKGKDVLAKARTGTGKTVAFLVPSIEVILKSPAPGRDQKRPPFLALVVCPTRELASQAAAEASTLLKYHPSIGVQVVIGGTRLALEQKRMQTNPCQIIVATPGRLRDHTENTPGFATRLMGVQVLVLDEADHLLDMGFRKDIEKIIAAIPKQRQTLLFSATVPDEVRQICHVALKRDHEYINTVQEGSEETHTQVKQMHLVAPLDKHFPVLYSMLKDHIADDVNYKVLVFCTTAMMTALVADLLRELKLNVREIHSRKSQGYRTRVSDEFRKSKGLILVTSDVSARGVDYPDVSLVVQIGQPSDREQYIHRLGRTGRKGKEGQGILLLAPWEEFFIASVKDLPLTKAPVPLVDPDLKKKVERALSHVEMKSKEAAYQAWLGYYNSNKSIGRDKYKLVELANEFSRSMGLDSPPAIPKLVLGKMGLKNIPGLRCK